MNAAPLPLDQPSEKGWIIRFGRGGYMVMQVGVADPAAPFGPYDHVYALQVRDSLNGVPS